MMRGIRRLVVCTAVSGLLAAGAVSASLQVAQAAQAGNFAAACGGNGSNGFICNLDTVVPASSSISVSVDSGAASEQVSVDGNREYNAGWHTALDLHSLLTVSEIVTRAALERKESRGAHFRDDFPNKDKQHDGFNIVVRKGARGEMQLIREPIPPMREDLQQIIQEMK